MTKKESDLNSALSEKMLSSNSVSSRLLSRLGNPAKNLSTRDVPLTTKMKSLSRRLKILRALNPLETKEINLLKLLILKPKLSSESANTLNQEILESGIFSPDSWIVMKEDMILRRRS